MTNRNESLNAQAGLGVAPEQAAQAAGDIPALEPLLDELEFERAVELARGRHYQQAEEILDRLTKRGSRVSLANLDLRARMYAQQGRFSEAEALWRELIRQDPGNAAYQEGLRYVTRQQRAPHLGEALLRALKWAAALLLLAAVAVILLRLSQLQQSVEQKAAPQPVATIVVIAPTSVALPTAEARPTQPVPTAEGSERVVKGLDELKAQIATLQGRLNQTPQPTLAPTLPALDLKVAGLQAQAEPGKIVLTFEKGLFQYSWVMTAEGRNALRDLAYQLQPHASQLQITLIGFATEEEKAVDPFDPGNLGLMRALTVYDYLTRSFNLPGEAFTILSQDGKIPPFRNDSAQNREKNHTVVIWLTPRSR